MRSKTIQRKGKPDVPVGHAARRVRGGLPRLPRGDRNGNVPAVAYARASIAREIVSRRTAAGLTQGELATLAGVRIETVNRVEKARHTPSTATIVKLDEALRKVERGKVERARGNRRRV
jgi:DNA-binding XRE family transcriptional regulator